MYELRLSPADKQRFIGVAKEKLAEKKWKMGDLAKAIGRPVNSVYNFFSNSNRTHRFIAAEIARTLEMDFKDWR